MMKQVAVKKVAFSPQECDPCYSTNKTFLSTAVYQTKFISQ